jgi:hypothetical protein
MLKSAMRGAKVYEVWLSPRVARLLGRAGKWLEITPEQAARLILTVELLKTQPPRRKLKTAPEPK